MELNFYKTEDVMGMHVERQQSAQFVGATTMRWSQLRSMSHDCTPQ